MLKYLKNVLKKVKKIPDLTEQFKNGKLPEGWYYIQLQECVYADDKKLVTIDYYTHFCGFGFTKYQYLVEQVLAPVPSYDEWIAAQKKKNLL